MFSFMVTTDSDSDDLIELMLTDNLITLNSKSSEEIIFKNIN